MGERLRRLRSDAGMTQTQLAVAAGLSGPSSVSNIERGDSPPAMKTAARLAEALGTDVAYLLTGASADTPEATHEFGQRAAMVYDGASPDVRAMLEFAVEGAESLQRKRPQQPDQPKRAGKRRVAYEGSRSLKEDAQ